MNKGILAIFSFNTPAVVAGVICMLAYNKMSASSSKEASQHTIHEASYIIETVYSDWRERNVKTITTNDHFTMKSKWIYTIYIKLQDLKT